MLWALNYRHRLELMRVSVVVLVIVLSYHIAVIAKVPRLHSWKKQVADTLALTLALDIAPNKSAAVVEGTDESASLVRLQTSESVSPAA